jgi:hypothetical protein
MPNALGMCAVAMGDQAVLFKIAASASSCITYKTADLARFGACFICIINVGLLSTKIKWYRYINRLSAINTINNLVNYKLQMHITNLRIT